MYAAAARVTQNVIVGLTAQAITFAPAPTGVKVGQTGVRVSATATSGLAVKYTSNTPAICSVDPASGALTLLAAGTCTIAADQAGNGMYAAAARVTQYVIVGAPAPDPITIVAGATATPGAATPPPTSSGGAPGGDSTPLFALLICLAFGALGLLAVQAQRRTIRH